MLLSHVPELVHNVAEHVCSEMVCNVAGFTVRNVSGQLVRNVSGQVSNVGGFPTRVRNVSVSGSEMVPDVGLLTGVVGQSTNLISLYGSCCTIAHPYRLLASTYAMCELGCFLSCSFSPMCLLFAFA